MIEIAGIEKQLEHQKHELALKPDFNICDAFRIFDERECGYVSLTDFKNGLTDLGISEPHEHIELFYKRFDRNQDGLIGFSEFTDAFTPHEQYYAQIISRRTSSHRKVNPYRKDDIFEHQTACQYKHFLRSVFALEAQAESLRSSIARNPLFNLD